MGKRVVVDSVPGTWSDERMHVMSDTCWCEPVRYREPGYWRRQHYDQAQPEPV